MNTKLLSYFIVAAISVAVALILSPIVGAVSTYFTKVAGIPVNPDVEVTTFTASPNEKIINIRQPGKAVFTVVRAKIVDINAVLNDENKIIGFKVVINVKVPKGAATNLKVVIRAETYDGEIIEGSNIITVDATKTYTVEVMLAKPINSDDLAYLLVDVIPT